MNASNTATESQPAQTQADYEGREVERWLKGTRVSAKEVDVSATSQHSYAELTEQKPSLLHALVLHLIKHERFREALDELETYVHCPIQNQTHTHHSRYLTSYPYLLSGPLHTYAGLLSFYLAQPQSALASHAPATNSTSRQDVDDAENLPLDTASTTSRPSLHSEVSASQTTRVAEPPNPVLLRQARAYFVKAVSLDGSDQVAADFIELVSRLRCIGVFNQLQIDHPDQARERSQSTVNRSRGESVGDSDGKSDEESVEGGKEEKHEDIGSFSEDSETDLEDLMGQVDDSEGSEDDI